MAVAVSRDSRLVTIGLAALMTVQALLGRLFESEYRDPEPIATTWIGNDWVTLLVAVPLLLVGLRRASRHSVPGYLIWTSMLAYGVYNYAFYLFGAALNRFLPIYALSLLLAVVGLLFTLGRLDVTGIASAFRPATPVRAIGGTLVFIAVGLATAWLAMWSAYAFGGRPTPIDPEAFKVVAALDLTLMVPALAAGGTLLWQRAPWGYVLATIASVQGALYLLVLTVNSLLVIRHGLAEPPGELPVWGALGLVTTVLAILLLVNAGGPARKET